MEGGHSGRAERVEGESLSSPLQDNSEFVAQMKEMDSFNNDLRQSSRKVGS
jgi:hypothetical protein